MLHKSEEATVAEAVREEGLCVYVVSAVDNYGREWGRPIARALECFNDLIGSSDAIVLVGEYGSDAAYAEQPEIESSSTVSEKFVQAGARRIVVTVPGNARRFYGGLMCWLDSFHCDASEKTKTGEITSLIEAVAANDRLLLMHAGAGGVVVEDFNNEIYSSVTNELAHIEKGEGGAE